MSDPRTVPETAAAKAAADEQPSPILGDWRKVYAAVVLELAVTVALLYALTRWAS